MPGAGRRRITTNAPVAYGTPAAGRFHVRASIKECGFNEANIKAIILQQAIGRGVPAANHPFEEAAEVIAEFTRSK